MEANFFIPFIEAALIKLLTIKPNSQGLISLKTRLQIDLAA